MQKTQVFGNYWLQNCHGQYGLLCSLLDLMKDTKLFNSQWQTGLRTTYQLMVTVHQGQRTNPAINNNKQVIRKS